jgi:hypothetical protein
MAVVAVNNFGKMKFIGLQADTKPTTAPTGSIFIEADTGRRFVFDATAWQQQL